MGASIYNQEALTQLLKNWKNSILNVSEIYSQTPSVFWARIIEDFLNLENKFASEKMSLAFALILLIDKIEKK